MEGKLTKILKQAFYLTKEFKFFWVLGLFLVWPNFLRGLLLLAFFSSWWITHPLQQGYVASAAISSNIWIGITALLLIGLAVIYYFRSKGMLFALVSQLRTKKDINKTLGREESEPYTIQLLKVGLGLVVVGFLIAAVLSAPTAYLSNNDYTSRAASLGITALLIYLPIFLIIYFTSIFSPMFIVLSRLNTGNSIRASFDLIRKNWTSLVSFCIVLFVLDIGAFFISSALAAIAATPFVLLLNVFYDNGGSVSLEVLQALAVITAFVVFFISQAVVSAFDKIAWVIVFFEIIKPIKAQEILDPETLPEIAS
ncbi:MAG: hypothetical protein KW793_04020 [Candidatus Doudnabacteria bacterium]|nr:hypothetical protein [Candidatus Doudnabacteria bacterium]